MKAPGWFSLFFTLLLPMAPEVFAATPPDFQHYLASNHYGSVRTEGNGENQQFFDAKINGKTVHFLLDTGANVTGITRDTAERLGLTIKDTGKTVLGMGGNAGGTAGLAPIASFTINNWEINRLSTVLVFPRFTRLGGADGIFGFDALRLNAAILTIAGQGFMIRPGQLGKGAPIDDYMRKSGFTPVPMTFTQNQILVKGTLNQKPFAAQIDCGATYSCFSLPYLRKMHVSPRWLPMNMQGVDGRSSSAQGFTPDAMTLGSFRVPVEMMMTQESPAFESGRIDALLGYEFLAERGAVIDAGSATLWLK